MENATNKRSADIIDLPISEADLFRELERVRGERQGTEILLTPTQKKFLLQARQGKRPLQWKQIRKLWEKAEWGKVSDTSIRRRYDMAKYQ